MLAAVALALAAPGPRQSSPQLTRGVDGQGRTEMTDSCLPAFAAFLGGIVISRFITENALKRLSVEQKASVLDAFSVVRRYNLVGLVAIVLLVFYQPLVGIVVMFAYILLLAGYKVTILMRLAVPREFKRSFVASMAVSYASLVIFAVLVFR